MSTCCLFKSIFLNIILFYSAGVCEFRQATVKRGRRYSVASKGCRGAAVHRHHQHQTHQVSGEVNLNLDERRCFVWPWPHRETNNWCIIRWRCWVRKDKCDVSFRRSTAHAPVLSCDDVNRVSELFSLERVEDLCASYIFHFLLTLLALQTKWNRP